MSIELLPRTPREGQGMAQQWSTCLTHLMFFYFPHCTGRTVGVAERGRGTRASELKLSAGGGSFVLYMTRSCLKVFIYYLLILNETTQHLL